MRHVMLMGLFLVCACGQGSTAKIRMIPNVIAGSQVPPVSANSNGIETQQGALRVGSPAAMNIQSLKYYVTSIQLCQNVVLMGSGYSSTEGCIQLYQNQGAGSPDYNSYTVTQAKDDVTPGRYIDLMSAEGQAALRQPVTLEVPVSKADSSDSPDGGPSQTGAYRYGLINFYRPIKVTAQFPVVGQPDQYFRTRAVTNIHTGMTPDGRFNTQKVEIGDTLSGPSEEMTYMLNNGGALFTFQKPFVITQADVDNNVEIKIDLVFNPDSFGQAYETADCLGDQWSAVCDPLNNVVIDMPYVRMNPVPRKSGERTHKETYLMDYDGGTKLRVELYYNDGDAEAGVQGVDVAVIYPSDLTSTIPHNAVVASNFVSQSGSVNTADASVTLMDYQHAPSVDGLVRRQDGTATLHCLYAGSLCPSVGGSATMPYRYLGDTIVSSD